MSSPPPRTIITVEGSLRNHIDDSDSSSCDSDNDNEDRDLISLDDEEESLEYFGSNNNFSLSENIKISNADSFQLEPSISTVLSEESTASVFEDFGTTSFNTITTTNIIPENVEIVPLPIETETEDNSTKVEIVEEDDEFSLDCNTSSDQHNDAIRRALDSVANRSVTEAATVSESLNVFITSNNNVDFNVQSPNTTTALYQSMEEPISFAADTGGDGKVSSAAAVRRDAQKAFNDIVEVYGGGLGDNEVLQLGTGIDRLGVAAVLPVDKSVAGNVIEEGDEDAEEEEEAREAEAVAQLADTTTQLQSEWDALAPVHSDQSVSQAHQGVVTPEENSRSPGSFSAPQSSDDFLTPVNALATSSQITYKTALRQLLASDLQPFESLIVVKDDSARSGWFGLGAPRAISYPRSDKDLQQPFLLAQLDYDPALHLPLLASLFAFFVGEAGGSMVNSTGQHWEKLGFQGVDPRTDLNRSMKMLSVLQVPLLAPRCLILVSELSRLSTAQMFHLVDALPHFARNLHTLSESATAAPTHLSAKERSRAVDRSWPFMCVSVMFTKEAVQALRSGVLNDKCNKRRSVMSVVHDFHHSCFAEFHRLLISQPTVHHAVHLAAIRKTCETSPMKLLKQYKQQYLQPSGDAKSAAPPPTAHSSGPKEEVLARFDNLEALTEERLQVDQTADQQQATQNGGWGAVFGGGKSKASKFQVS